MKKFTSLLIGCSLALAGAALAQQPEEQTSPTKGKGKHNAEATQSAQPQASANAETGAGAGKKQHGAGKNAKVEAKSEANTANTTNPEATTATTQGGAKGERRAERRAARMQQKNEGAPKSDASATGETGTTGATGQPGLSATPNEQLQGKHGRKGRNARGANANASPSATVTGATGAAGATGSATPVTAATPSVAPTVAAAAGQQNVGAKVKKADQQQVQQIKSQHVNFKAQPRPDKVPAVTFNQNYRIEGSDRWQGPQYEVFRSYHPERHDERWYHSHYTRVELIGGGYYYMNNGYWYPAWGYNPSNEYYAYDGPIYVGHRSEPPDRVIADVQAELQYLGYYKGEVDGLLGPLTRQALTAYQTEQGLMPTAAIDQPTLEALDMG